jgi:Fe-Mn family superoxide dismutase
MTRVTFSRFSIIFTVTIFVVCGLLQPANSYSIGFESTKQDSIVSHKIEESSQEFILPPLPYSYEALEPYISSEIMTLHHDRHHAGYVQNLNEAISLHPELKGLSIEKLLTNLDRLPKDIQVSVRNNGGGHYNHSLFWDIMSSKVSQPSDSLAEAIALSFGDLTSLKAQITDVGNSVFGSGWVWLIVNDDDLLEIKTTANQDNPLMEGKYPLLGIDLWEHAYYLMYWNKRADYLDNWVNHLIDWETVNNRFELAKRINYERGANRQNDRTQSNLP